ncbi:MAG: helix-turn-helix domain-containing protein [Candidatus Micrarchaeia archaeon]
MADDLETLQEAGLTPNEAKLYMLLVQHGRMKATELAKRSGLHRVTVYDTLEQLERKGLAGKAEVKGVLSFETSPPAALLTFVDEKRNAVERLLPRLARSFEGDERVGTSVIYGVNGIKMMFEDVISLRADFCVYHGQLQFVDIIPKFYTIFNEKRKRLGIRGRFMVLDLPEVHERAKKVMLAEFKYIDPTSPSGGVWWTYADRVVLFIIQKEITTIFVKNAELARAFRKNFEASFEAAGKSPQKTVAHAHKKP